MDILKLLKKREGERIAAGNKSNKQVHDDINKYSAHILKVQHQAITVDRKIKEAKLESKKLEEMLTVTQRVLLGAGRNR